MSSPKFHLRLTCVALTISLALTADWVAGPWFHIEAPWVRWSLFILNLVLTAASLSYLLSHVRATQNAALRELDLLCRADIRDLAAGTVGTSLPSLPPESGWVKALMRLRGHLIEVVGRMQELAHERAASESRALRQEWQAQRITAIFSGLAEPVIATDKYDELVLSNPSADQLFAIDLDATESRALANLVQCEKLVDLLQETRKRKSPGHRSCEIEMADDSGRSHWYRATARTIAQDPSDGNPQGAVAMLHDISSEKTIQKRNAEFVSAFSHEMKNPLTTIKAYAELLIDGDAKDQHMRDEFLGTIGAEANRLQRLVENMLNIARIEAGVVMVNKQSQPLNDLLAEALQMSQIAARNKNITLRNELSPLYLRVLIDRDMLLQAAINLISNAVKYTPPGGQVTLRSKLSDSEIRFDVEDNGVGLSPEDCQKVFEKFYRVPQNKDMAPGTGLGLALVRQIVEDVHGGRIDVQSTLGQGTVFSVFLPSAGTLERPRAKSQDASLVV